MVGERIFRSATLNLLLLPVCGVAATAADAVKPCADGTVASYLGTSNHRGPRRLAPAQAGGLAPVQRIQVAMDDGTRITVDNASHMSNATASNLVLLADRSTQTGCPSTQAAKGFMMTGDRVLATDYYVAWFDYTIQNGSPLPSGWPNSGQYPRSGGLAGYWSLNPSKQTFHYPYSVTSGTGKGDPAHNICADWAHNELIPGSDSPGGQLYWWDIGAPPLEDTIVVPETSDGTTSVFLSSPYAQKVPGSNWTVVKDGAQDSNRDVHYETSSYMATMLEQTTTYYTSLVNGQQGQIFTTIEYICGNSGIEVVWNFEPTVTTYSDNLYVSAWLSYTGQDPSLCYNGSVTNYPAPTDVYGYPSPKDPYQNVLAYRPDQPPNGIVAFPFSQAITACKGGTKNIDVGLAANGTPLPRNTYIEFGAGPNVTISSLLPNLKMVQLAVPNSGTGTQADPIAFPFLGLSLGYDYHDEHYQTSLLNGPHPSKPSLWVLLQGNTWYQVHYILTDASAP